MSDFPNESDIEAIALQISRKAGGTWPTALILAKVAAETAWNRRASTAPTSDASKKPASFNTSEQCVQGVNAEQRKDSDARDAERYRWLRDKSEPGICAFYLSVGKAFDGVKFKRDTVDAAIDAAMQRPLPAPPEHKI